MARMKQVSTVLERGQVTIPKQLRQRLGIQPGTRLEFTAAGGKLIATKEQVDDPVRRLYGTLKTGKTTDEMMDELRGRR